MPEQTRPWVSIMIGFTKGGNVARAISELEEAGFDVYAEYADWTDPTVDEFDASKPQNPIDGDGRVAIDEVFIDASVEVDTPDPDFQDIEARIVDIVAKHGGTISKRREMVHSGDGGK
jgi:hypothetical protein